MATFDWHSYLNTFLLAISIMHNAHVHSSCRRLSLVLFSDFESYRCIIVTSYNSDHQNTVVIQSSFISSPTCFDRVSLSGVRLLEWRQILQAYIIRYNHLDPVHIPRADPRGCAVQGVL